MVGRADFWSGEEAADRLETAPVRLLRGTRNGRFRPAPGSILRPFQARLPMVVAADFNGDDQPDLAVFDYGVYVTADSVGVGNPPQLFRSRTGGRRLYPSTALADAVRTFTTEHPNPDYSGPADLHVKAVAAGDLDGDGDVDIWVQSTGGANVGAHVMVNDGTGAFTVDTGRVPPAVPLQPAGGVVVLRWGAPGRRGRRRRCRRATGAVARPGGPDTVNQFNIVLLNDGTGHFPARVELPHARFCHGSRRSRGWPRST